MLCHTRSAQTRQDQTTPHPRAPRRTVPYCTIQDHSFLLIILPIQTSPSVPHTYILECMCTYLCSCSNVHLYIHTLTYTHIHTYIQTAVHKCTHTDRQAGRQHCICMQRNLLEHSVGSNYVHMSVYRKPSQTVNRQTQNPKPKNFLLQRNRT